MPIEDELAEFFFEDIDCVVDNPEKFRSQLQIGSDAFKYLSSAENIGNFTQIAGAGTLVGAATSVGWFTSLGVLGKVGLGFGIGDEGSPKGVFKEISSITSKLEILYSPLPPIKAKKLELIE